MPARRLRPLLAFVPAALLAITFTVLDRATTATLRSSLEGRADPDTIEQAITDHRTTLAAVALATIVAAALLGFAAGRLAARPLARIRDRALALARGDRSPPATTGVAELHAIESAIDLLANELAGRVRSLTRDRDDLSLLVTAVTEGILRIDENGRIIVANPAAQMLLGLPQGARGQPLASLVRNAELRRFVERAAIARETASCEVNVDERRLLVTARPIDPQRAHDGADAGMVLGLTDLTELRRLEGVRRDFVANVSHELKTPLTSIRGYVETLMSDDLPPEMQRQFLEVIHKNAERLRGIVDDLLDLSRLESGGWRPELEQLRPLSVADEVWSHCRERAAAKRIEFTREGDDTVVTADPSGLRHVFANLFDNALRHTPDGGHITVRVAPSRNGSAAAGRRLVTLEIQDTGSGIPLDSLARVFERFYRVDPARSRAEGGTGLGLSIVKHLVESMGGDVTAESELGKGTTMRVRLPAA